MRSCAARRTAKGSWTARSITKKGIWQMKSPNEDSHALKSQYWDGFKNKSIRYYYYVRRGLELLNEFRYLIMGILGFYYALKLDNPMMMVVMFGASIPILIILGWLMVHHIAKVIEWLNIQYSTHWSRYTYDLQEEIIKQLKEINEKLSQ